MKIFSLSAFVLVLFFGTASAHDIHHRASDHTHPERLYTHSVSSHFDHHRAHHHGARHKHKNYSVQPAVHTETYYTRNYPVKNTYTFYRPANTTIHQPPFAYSSCAHNCQSATPQRVMVSRKTGSRNYTYRAPSEFNHPTYIHTPAKHTANCKQPRTTYVSPYKRHQLTTTCYTCHQY